MRSKLYRRVVTLGGGHGQAAAIQAALKLGADVTAVPSVADEGGCSGQLRRAFGLAPPGDARRCLAAMASDRGRAEELERRGPPGDAAVGRVLGNLLLAGFARRDGDLQAACDRVGTWVGARGRVAPAALAPMTVVGVDAAGGSHVGELAVELCPRRLRTMYALPCAAPNPAALEAIERADLLLLGPGSFFTSVLAALAAPGVARAVVRSRAERVWLANLSNEGPQTEGMTLPGFVESLRAHVSRFAGERLGELTVIAPGERHTATALDPETRFHRAPLRSPRGTHDPVLLARALTVASSFERSEQPTARMGRAA